jgi:hypothetical protein
MGRLKPAVTGDVGGFVVRWLGPRNIGEGAILRGAQNDGSFGARENSRTKVLTRGWGRIIVTGVPTQRLFFRLQSTNRGQDLQRRRAHGLG